MHCSQMDYIQTRLPASTSLGGKEIRMRICKKAKLLGYTVRSLKAELASDIPPPKLTRIIHIGLEVVASRRGRFQWS